MAAYLNKYHIAIEAKGYVLNSRDGKTYYQKKIAPTFVNKFGSGDSSYRVLGLFESGQLGTEYSPYSVDSPVNTMMRILDYEKRLKPHLQAVKDDRSKVAEELRTGWGVIEETKELLLAAVG